MLRVVAADGRVAVWCSDDVTPLDEMVRELFGDSLVSVSSSESASAAPSDG